MTAAAITVVQLIGTKDETTNDANISVPYTNVPTIGNHVVCFGTCQANSLILNSVSDTTSNPWQIDVDRFFDTSAGTANQLIWVASTRIDNDCTGKSIALTLSGSNNRKLSAAFEISGLHRTNWFGRAGLHYLGFDSTRFAANQAGIWQPAVNAGDIMFVFCKLAQTETGLTVTSPWTFLPWSGGLGYFNGTAGSIQGGYYITTDLSYRGDNPKMASGGAFVGFTGLAATYRRDNSSIALDTSNHPKITRR